MSRSFTIRTPRLTLVPRTIELAETELQRPEAFPKLLGAIAPGNWPPELLIDARPQFLEALRGNPTLLRWFDCYILLRDESGGLPTLIGGIGFIADEGQPVVLQLGYSLLPQFHNRGYCTEAVAALLEWAFSHEEVSYIYADTFPELGPSIRVLRKSGFEQRGAGAEERSIRFVLGREGYLRRGACTPLP